MQARIAGKGFGALVAAATLGAVCSQVLTACFAGAPAHAAETPSAPAATPAGGGELRASALVIVDAKGKERARLGLVDELDAVQLTLHDPGGQQRIYLAANSKGCGLELHDPQGTLRYSVGAGSDGGGLVLYDPKGNPRLNFGAGPDGGALKIGDAKGVARFSFGEGGTGGGMALYDSAGKERFHVGAAGKDYGLKLFDAEGRSRMMLFGSADGWLGLTLHDTEGSQRAGLTMSPEQKSTFFVRGGRTDWEAPAR